MVGGCMELGSIAFLGKPVRNSVHSIIFNFSFCLVLNQINFKYRIFLLKMLVSTLLSAVTRVQNLVSKRHDERAAVGGERV